MKLIYSIISIICLIASLQANAQKIDTTQANREVYIGLIRDSYNGFFVIGSGTFQFTKNTYLTVYALMRNIQTGIGPTFKLKNNTILISPLLGMTYGNKFSGYKHPIIGDAIVPSLLLKGKGKTVAFDLYAFWFLPTRNVQQNKSEYLWFWSNGGIRVSKTIHLGVHVETLQLLESKEKSPGAMYFWLGPNVLINFSEKAQFRVSGGKDFTAYEYMKVDFAFFVD